MSTLILCPVCSSSKIVIQDIANSGDTEDIITYTFTMYCDAEDEHIFELVFIENAVEKTVNTKLTVTKTVTVGGIGELFGPKPTLS